ncbi:ribonuclease catalytic domain-containing protein [Desulfobacca acetoxidans]
MENYQIVEFFEERKIYCAFVADDRGERLHVVTEHNREVNLPRKRVIHAAPWSAGASLSRHELVERLRAVGARRETLKQDINLFELWELLVNETEGLSAADLARTWYGDGVTSDQIAALGRALYEDRFYFKFKGNVWSPHPPEVVEGLQEQHRREEERRQELKTAAGWLRAAWESGNITDPHWRERLLTVLQNMAVHGATHEDYELGKAYLEEAKLFKPDAPFKLLVKLGVFSPDENLDLHRYETPQDFPAEIQEAALALCQKTAYPDPFAPWRVDLTGLQLFTIDGERTRDFDDALSLEKIPEGWRLGVHITDVSTYIPLGTPLDQAALERGTSLYLPDRRIPMLPEALSENTLSLLAQHPRRAVSFLVNLTAEGEIKNYSILLSMVQVSKRFTYHEVDYLLAQNERLAALHRLTACLRERRLSQGGVQLQFPDVTILTDASGEVRVEIEDTETPSHELVSEAMILANYLGAQYLAERKVPVLYRSQAPPREELEKVETGSLFQLWQNRRRLSRVLLDLEPQPHWGLGLPVYTTISSPIRRYLDLIIHRQLFAALCNQPTPYTREALEGLLTLLEPTLRRAALLKTRRLRYWLLKFLSQHVGQKFSALILEKHPNRYRLLFLDILLESEMPAPSGHQFQPGETIFARIDRVVPQEDVLKVSLA